MTRVRVLQTSWWHLPDGATHCGAGTAFANPFRVMGAVDHRSSEWWVECEARRWPADSRGHAHQLAADLHRNWIMHPDRLGLRNRVRETFCGHAAACPCPLDLACHADTLAELAVTPMEGQPQ